MLIKLTGITKIYETKKGTLIALKDLNLEIREGEFFGIVGPNGCGKSTLLNIISGLLKPTSGRVEFIDAPPNQALTSMVWQDFALLPWRVVETNVGLPPEIKHKPEPVYKRITNMFLSLVRLRSFEKVYPHELSSGMQQRVSIARALANEPRVLLMDEPFANLDAQIRIIMREELVNIWEKEKKTIIFVTHNLEEAILMCDKIGVMSGRPGRIKETITINLPRPRTFKTMANPKYGEIYEKIWTQLESDVKKAMLEKPVEIEDKPKIKTYMDFWN